MDHDLLTTSAAADLLNVSHEFLLELVRGGRIQVVRHGGEDVIPRADLLAYRRERDDERQRKLVDLVEISEDAGGYSELD